MYIFNCLKKKAIDGFSQEEEAIQSMLKNGIA